MAQPFTVDLQGIADIQARLKKASTTILKDVDGVLQRGAGKIAEGAARDAPVDEGSLRRGITFKRLGLGSYEVISAASHSPYIEWGTKRKAKVPAELSSYAAQFKGLKTGSAEEALNAIKSWVKRKGVRFDSEGTFKSGKKKGANKPLTVEQTAYIIFHFIMINGIEPRPFFFKNFNEQEPEIIRDVTKVLGDVL